MTRLTIEPMGDILFIQGSPGTGKTYKAFEMAVQRWQDGDTVIYISGDLSTNTARAFRAMNSPVLSKENGNTHFFWLPDDPIDLSQPNKIYIVHLKSLDTILWRRDGIATKLLSSLFPQVPEKCTIIFDAFPHINEIVHSLPLLKNKPRLVFAQAGDRDKIEQLQESYQTMFLRAVA